MADTVWSQIVVLFDGFFRSMSLFVVFTVFTSMMSLFLVISFQTPLKNPTRRAGGTKASGFVPPSLRDGFLRGVKIPRVKQVLNDPKLTKKIQKKNIV